MAVLLAAAGPSRISWRLASRSWVVTTLKVTQRPGALLRLATAGAVGGSIGLPVVDLARIVAGWTPSPGHGVAAVVATACYLPLHVRHVWYAVRGVHPPAAGWTLAAMAVVVIGAIPVIGTGWLVALSMLVVSVLVVVRPPWSFVAAAGLVSTPAPVAVVFGDAEWAPLYTASVIWQGASLFVLVWLVGAARRLQTTRSVLAEEAVARERMRLDRELDRTLGVGLERIVAMGQRAGELAARDPVAARDALRALVDGSRAALAEARRVVTRYQGVSLRTELDAAATLLRAGGMEVTVVLPPGDLPDAAEPGSRSALRSAVARMLRDGAAQRCAIVVTRQDGRLHVELESRGTGTQVDGGGVS